jgi:hypothetical protein
MLTATYAVENLFGADHDLWAVNVDDDYHEEHRSDTGRGTTTPKGTGRDAPVLP